MKNMVRYCLLSCLLLITINCLGQLSKDTSTSNGMSPLKSMDYEQYKAYTNGVDINNMGLVAELNHYPSPQKVIDLQKELNLTTEQSTKINAINAALKFKLKEMGGFIIKNEQVLDNLFRTKKLDDGTLIFYATRFGLYQGEMRNAILQAYLKTRGILTPLQIKKYEVLQKGQH